MHENRLPDFSNNFFLIVVVGFIVNNEIVVS